MNLADQLKRVLSGRLHANQNGTEESSKGEGEGEAEMSDMEGSQVSLPRSYTLPREFKYNHPNGAVRERERRAGNNKVPPSRFYLPSTNSSDGECASCLPSRAGSSQSHAMLAFILY